MVDSEQIEQLSARVHALEQGLQALQNPGGSENGRPRTAVLPVEQADEVALFEILGVDGKTILRTETEARFSWKLTVQSRSQQALRIDAQIQLVDMDSFALLEEHIPALLLEPAERQKFSGILELPLEVEAEVMGVKGRVTLAG